VRKDKIELSKAEAYWIAALGRTKRLPNFESWMRPPKPGRALEGDEAEERKKEHEEFAFRFEEAMKEKESEHGD